MLNRYRLSLYLFALISLIGCKARDHHRATLKEALNRSIVKPQKIGNMMVIGETDLTDNRNVAAGIPEDKDGGRSTANDVVISRKQFVVAFDGKAKIPVWTAWQLTEQDVGRLDRMESFRGDKILNTFIEASPNTRTARTHDAKGATLRKLIASSSNCERGDPLSRTLDPSGFRPVA
jgi:hypothetical protein